MKKLISLILAGCLLIAPVVGASEMERVATVHDSPYTQTRELIISGEIDEYSLVQFLKDTAYAEEGVHYNIYLHTDGGDAYSTVGIINRIVELKKRGVTFATVVYAKALSAGSYIWMMGDERVVYEGASLMFHKMLQQVTKAQEEFLRETRQNAIEMNMVERMDTYIEDRFREVVGDNMSDNAINYFLDGDGDETNAQFMSAETARNIGLATEYRGIH